MKRIVATIVLFVSLSAFTNWQHNLNDAFAQAQKEHKYVLLNFSGSDWCGPCIKMHRDIFDNPIFEKYASTELVLVNADFPRQKKNQLSSAQQAINNSIADKYNTQGSFPLTVLLNDKGKVVKSWDGYPKATINEFIADIAAAIDTDKH
ncbi:thioredoxin family protein [Parasediminibacterium paludis]|uniref:Thioredoxin family protein n=1 Tax=Parasediminibacterium paludis TaxID=908966 RepID=A0ABV8Q255_9BACT